jgi:multiple sugar transport system ATP-binding protein
MSEVQVRNIRKFYGAMEAIKGVDLEVRDREFVVLVGPSGCGKSTLLRMIAGLEEISSGDLLIDGERMNDVPASRRGLAMVFQSYALYPHMTVFQNMSVGLRIARMDKTDIHKKVMEAARILQLEPLLGRKPRQLSGGQRQRVAIGRAIVRDPKIFLFDEPLSNLDAALRLQMRLELARLKEDLDATMIYVTHDQVEAMTLADRIVVMNEGQIEQIGTPEELYARPVNTFVAGFIGSPTMNVIPATVSGRGANGAMVIDVAGIRLERQIPDATEGTPLTAGIRPEDVLTGDFAVSAPSLEGRVRVVERLGANSFAYLVLANGQELTVEIKGMTQVKTGELMSISLPPEHIHVFGEDGNRLNLA